jgi:1,4-alpha-glucan branching enzyme
MQIAFLITAQLPYLRRAGPSPLGEEPLHTLAAQALLPLLTSLHDMQAKGLQPRIALALAPLVLEQLADLVVQKHFLLWLESYQQQFAQELAQFSVPDENHTAYLARFDHEWAIQAEQSFASRFKRNIALAFRELVQAGLVEPLTAPATLPSLPLLGSNASARAQIEQGIMSTLRHLGRPQGIWLERCGWRAGLDPAFQAGALRYAVVDGELINWLGKPVWLTNPERGRKLIALTPHQGLAAHLTTTLGYPGDPLYRTAGQVGSREAQGLFQRLPYDPYHAYRRAQEHAEHFVSLLLAEAEQRDPDDLLLLSLDAQLLGGSWFEGSAWFQIVLSECLKQPTLQLTTPGDYLRGYRPGQNAAPRPNLRHGHPAPDYWSAIHSAEQQLIALTHQANDLSDEHERVLNQAARELLLAQSGHWLHTDPAAATPSWREYLQRFAELCALATKPRLNSSDLFTLGQLEERDGPFPTLNYRVFS